MKKILLATLLVFTLIVAKSQVVNTYTITSDTTIWLSFETTKFGYDLSYMAYIDTASTSGTATFGFLNSPSDTIEMYMDSGIFTISSDTVLHIIDDKSPCERYGIKTTNFTGTVTTYFSRKTVK